MTAASAVAGAALTAGWQSANAQSTSDIDALNFMINIEYLQVQFLFAVFATPVPASLLIGNGLQGVPPIPGKAVTFTDPQLRATVIEMANDAQVHLNPIRTIVGAPVVRQPLMNISAAADAPFTAVMRGAGVIGTGDVFDPYASEENLLYALFYLKNVSVIGYRSLAPTIGNRIVTRNFTGLLGSEAVHQATIRSYLYKRGAALPRLRENGDKIAAFQRSLNGGDVFQGVSQTTRTIPGSTATADTAKATSSLSTGQVGTRTAPQLLNQLYVTKAATASGGFFPEGVNGTIRTSAAA